MNEALNPASELKASSLFSERDGMGSRGLSPVLVHLACSQESLGGASC